MVLLSHEIVQVNNNFFSSSNNNFLNDAVRSLFFSRKIWIVLESDGNVCIGIDSSRLLNNLLTLGNIEVSRIWSCYINISRETWIHALYFRLDLRKRHVRNLFREKDIDHFDNQMCGRYFLLKPGVHKLLEIRRSDKLLSMKWLLTNQQTENGAIASWEGFQSLQPSRWALAHKINWHPPQKPIRINHFLTKR